jgi:hypothetical protein
MGDSMNDLNRHTQGVETMNDRVRKALVALAALAALALLAGPAWAGTEERTGTSGNPAGRIMVGPRSVGMAYSNLASVTGVEALFGNPAGLAVGTGNTEVLLSHAAYIADMDLNYVAIAQSIGALGRVGVSVKALSIGDIIRTTEIAPDGTGDVFQPTFMTLGFSYAKAVTDRVNFGGSMKVITEKVLQTASTDMAFDFGFQYDTGVRGIRLGAAMQNFGNAQHFGGEDLDRSSQFPEDDPEAAPRTVSLTTAEAELPALFTASASYPVMAGVNALELHGVYQSNSFSVDEFRFGGEYTYRKQFALRLGYKYTSQDSEIFGLTYGLGVQIPLGSTKMDLDYAGQSVSDFFNDVQHVGLTFRF